ncbi:hypothetical protein [Actinotalea sp. C106]|uniref:hypothetical protein n=1 Tax=Actinotalea sp. C106 TaxID=2908644 RepID=UPI00202895B2|nr:hypothetical protein [Actinotalea sp. C106]
MDTGDHVRQDERSGYARSAARWMRAYPRRWRESRGEELLGVLLDLAPPGADRVDARTALDLVRSGSATRWRGRPPWPVWLRYRLVGWRMPTAYRGWARDDILGAGFWWRENVVALAIVLGFAMASWSAEGAGAPGWGYWAFCLGAFVTGAVYGSGYRQQQAMLKHVVLRAGDPVQPGAWVMQEVPRRRLRASSLLPWLAGSLLAAAVLLVTSVATAPKITHVLPTGPGSFETVVGPVGDRAPWLALVAAAAVLGGVLALVARRRLRTVGLEGPAQPRRRVVDLGRRRVASVLVTASWVVPLVWLETTGRLVLFLSVPLAMLVLVALPPVLVMTWTVRRERHDDLAARDVWTVAGHGRPPLPDGPEQRAVPLEVVGVAPWHARGTRPEDPPYPALS